MYYKLPEAVKKADSIVIYGTGEMAQQYFDQLKQLDLDHKVKFFMNTMPAQSRFLGRPVLSLTQVDLMAEKKEPAYLIASYGSAKNLAEALDAIDISSEKIVMPDPLPVEEGESYIPLLTKPVTHICYYPPIQDAIQLQDITERLNWYLPNRDQLQVILPSREDEQLERRLQECDLILVWTKQALSSRRIRDLKHKVACVDPEYLGTKESQIYLSLYYWTLSATARNAFVQLSISNFQEMLKFHEEKKKAVVFGSGPSLSRASEYKFDSAFKLICNGIVMNPDLLQLIQPDALAFSDAMWFSYTEFAVEFRQQVVKFLQQPHTYCIIPEKYLPLVLMHFPEYRKQMIGMQVMSTSFNIPSASVFSVRETGNVLTRFLLPVASAVADEVYVLGCDGIKEVSEEIWQHSDMLNLGSKINAAYEAHASSIISGSSLIEYYLQHYSYVNEFILFGEERGKKYYSLAPSYIPAFAARKADRCFL